MLTNSIKDLGSYDKLILYTLGQTKEGVKTDTHLHKLIFLTSNALGIDPKNLGFYPHNYGPYSISIKETEDSLLEDGFLIHNEDGLKVNSEIKNKIDDIAPKSEFDKYIIKEIANFSNGITREEILLLTYVRYPEYTVESKILKEVLENRIEVALELYKKNKITKTVGAELANISIFEFIDRINDENTSRR